MIGLMSKYSLFLKKLKPIYMFVDKLKVSFKAGKGGDGTVAWRREKFIPKGGPNGGDGGNGGSITLVADRNLFSLDSYSHKRLIKAEAGAPGGDCLCTGRSGKNLTVRLPLGTLVRDAVSGELIADLSKDKETFLLCKGGKGGLGNTHFKSSTHQAPLKTTPGTEGEEKEIEFELKLIADVGFVGAPNAGKSTLLTQIAKSREGAVKIGAYPFTTLAPNLAFREFTDYSRILFADIPGIIEKAHENKGLGLEFLRHVDRSSVLLFVLDASGSDGSDPLKDFRMLRAEIKEYSLETFNKPFIVTLNKMDLPGSKEAAKRFRKLSKLDPSLIFEISAKERDGILPLLKKLKELAQSAGKKFY